MTWPPLIWALTDDRPGNTNQVLGVAEGLGWPFQVKRLRFGPPAGLPNALLAASLLGVSRDARRELQPPWPAVAIAAGRRGAPVLRWLKRRQPALLAVQLMWPGSARGLDLVAVPEHDAVAGRPGVVRILGGPHRITPDRLRAAAAAWAPQASHLPRPWIACLIGGSTRRRAFTAADAAGLAREASRLAGERGGSLLITTSRRTTPDCVRALAEAIEAPHRLDRWAPDGNDPYLSVLGSADAVVVTADSVSMCIEACATGRPVFVFHPAAGVAAKVARLHRRLTELGHLHALGAPWPEQVPTAPNPAAVVATAIRRRFAGPIGAPGRPAVARSARTL